MTPAMTSLRRVAVFSIFSIILSFSEANNKVPVLIWSNNLSQKDLPPSIEGHSVSTQDFQKTYVDNLLTDRPQHVLVFIQDRLSIEDFTQYSNAYSENSNGAALQHVKEQMEKHSSTHVPSVESPATVVEHLKERFLNGVQEVKVAEKIDSLTFDKPGLILVHLPDVTLEEEEKMKQFSVNDGLIGAVMSKAEQSGLPFTAFFTAEETSKIPVQYPKLGRHLLASHENTSTYMNFKNCTLFYTTGVYISLSTVSTIVEKSVEKNIKTFVNISSALPRNPTFTADTQCMNMSALTNSSTMGLVYADDITIGDYTMKGLTIRFTFFGNSARQVWNISAIELTYQLSNSTVTLNATDAPTEMYVPTNIQDAQLSYSCSAKAATNYTQANITEYKGTPIEVCLDVRFDNMQIQPFGNGPKFLDASDCTGFFTIGTLSGLLVSLILLLILTWGMAMMANIKTMDRFDDPKGKGITVNVTE